MLDVMPIPEVTHRDVAMSLENVYSICQIYMDKREKPCSIVKIDDKVCYAFMNLKAETVGNVQCFKLKDKPLTRR